jgi:CBS domain-containing protein
MDRAATVLVRDVMTADPVRITSTTTIADLWRLFDEHDFNAFPVVDAGGTLKGIVTKLDLLRAFRAGPALELPDPATLERPVDQIMRPGVVTVEPQDPAYAAAELMVEMRLHSLPVVRRGGGSPRLVGFVSRGDLLRAFVPARSMPE